MAGVITLRIAEELDLGEPWYAAKLRAEGMEAARVAELIDRLAVATEDAWQRELAARRAALGVERLMPWDLGRPAAAIAPTVTEAAARMGFDLEALGIEVAIREGAWPSTDRAEGKVRVTAPTGAARTLLHELGHALLLAVGDDVVQASPLHEGVAEWVAGLTPLARGDALAELRLALARADFEAAVYGGEPPEVAYWRSMERIVGVTCDDAQAAWARLRHVETHPGRLAAYVMGAGLAAHLRRAAGGDDQRMGEMIRALARDPRGWEEAVAAVAGRYDEAALLAEVD